MKKFNGDLSICDKELMCDRDFMDKQRIENECSCVKQNTCKMVCDLLKHNKTKEALDVLKNM